MWTLLVLLGCGGPSLEVEPTALALPGRVIHGEVALTDDGQFLTLQHLPPSRPDQIAYVLAVVGILGAGLGASRAAWPQYRVFSVLIGGGVLACVAMFGWSSMETTMVVIDQPAEVVVLHRRAPVGPILSTSRRGFSELSRVGVQVMHTQWHEQLALVLLDTDGEEQRVVLGEAGDEAFAVAVRDHVAAALGGLPVATLPARWK